MKLLCYLLMHTLLPLFLLPTHISSYLITPFLLLTSVSSFHVPFSLYQIVSFAVLDNSSTVHATKLTDLAENFAINQGHQYYSMLSSEQCESCHGAHDKHCATNIALKPILARTSCPAIFQDIQIFILKLCDFHFIFHERCSTTSNISTFFRYDVGI